MISAALLFVLILIVISLLDLALNPPDRQPSNQPKPVRVWRDRRK
jgi:hypothetical protein